MHSVWDRTTGAAEWVNDSNPELFNCGVRQVALSLCVFCSISPLHTELLHAAAPLPPNQHANTTTVAVRATINTVSFISLCRLSHQSFVVQCMQLSNLSCTFVVYLDLSAALRLYIQLHWTHYAFDVKKKIKNVIQNSDQLLLLRND